MLYDRRDNLSALTMEVSEHVDVFRDMVDKEKVTIPRRSPKLFTISALYEANEELLGKKVPEQGSPLYAEILRRAVKYWTELSKIIGDWQKVKNGTLSASELRQEKINTQQARAATLAVLLREIGESPNGKVTHKESTEVTSAQAAE